MSSTTTTTSKPKKVYKRLKPSKRMVTRKKTGMVIPSYLKDSKAKGAWTNVKSLSPFPNKYFCKMTYGENAILTAGSTGLYGLEYVYRLNSLYDPDFAGVGHQPYGFDQMGALYRRYLVTAVSITLVFTDPSEDGMIVACSLQPSNATFTLTGASNNQLKEKPQIVTRMLNDSGEQNCIIKQFMPLHRLEGLHKFQWSANLAEYASDYNANPTRSPYLRVACASARNTSGATVMFRPLIKFYCQWYDRITLPQS